MVEVSDNQGQMFLKCPRATCQHRQSLAATLAAAPAKAKTKTLVRKRLVRRKA